MFDVLVYALLRKYIKDSLVGAGALKGASCQIQSIVRNPTDDANIVTYKWEDNAGGLHTSQMVVPDGVAPTVEVGEVKTVEYPKPASINVRTSDTGIILDFKIPRGKPGAEGGGDLSIESLTDVDITNLESGQILKYDAVTEKWVNADGIEIKALSDIRDVELTDLNDGQAIVWDATNSKWVNKYENVYCPDDLGARGDGVTVDDDAFLEGNYIYNLTEGKTYRISRNKMKLINGNGVVGNGKMQVFIPEGEDKYGDSYYDKSRIEPVNALEKSISYFTDANTFSIRDMNRNFHRSGVKHPSVGRYVNIGAVYVDRDHIDDLPTQFTVCIGRSAVFERKHNTDTWVKTIDELINPSYGIANYGLPWASGGTSRKSFAHTAQIVDDHIELVIDKTELTNWGDGVHTEGCAHFWTTNYIYAENEFDDLINYWEAWVKESGASGYLGFATGLDCRHLDSEETYQAIVDGTKPLTTSPQSFWSTTLDIYGARNVNFDEIASMLSQNVIGESEAGIGYSYNLLDLDSFEYTKNGFTLTYDKTTDIFTFHRDETYTSGWVTVELLSHILSLFDIIPGEKFRLNMRLLDRKWVYFCTPYLNSTSIQLDGSGEKIDDYTKSIVVTADKTVKSLAVGTSVGYDVFANDVRFRLWITPGETYHPYKAFGEAEDGTPLVGDILDTRAKDQIDILKKRVRDIIDSGACKEYDIMLSDAALFNLEDNTIFFTRGYYKVGDGNGGYYKITTTWTKNTKRIVSGNNTRYLIALDDDGWFREHINLCRFGIRRFDDTSDTPEITVANTYAKLNSDIVDSILDSASMQMGTTWELPVGRFYFERPINIGVNSKRLIGSSVPSIFDPVARDYAGFSGGTVLIFPFLANGEAAIVASNSTIKDVAIVGSVWGGNTEPNYDFSIDRTKTITAPGEVVSETVKQVDGVDYKTYGIRATQSLVLQNVFVMGFYTGVYAVGALNSYITNIYAKKCHTGFIFSNDTKVVGMFGWNVHTLVELFYSISSITQLRVDSCMYAIKLHDAIENTITDVDGDFCVGSLVVTEGVCRNNNLISIHGRCCTVKSYDKTQNPNGIDVRSLADTAGYGVIRATNTFTNNYIVLNAGVNGNPFDETSDYMTPKIIFTYDKNLAGNRVSGNTFVISESVDEAQLLREIQTGSDLNLRVDTASATYLVDGTSINNATMVLGEWKSDGGRNLNLLGFSGDFAEEKSTHKLEYDSETDIFTLTPLTTGGSSISITSHLIKIPEIKAGEKFRFYIRRLTGYADSWFANWYYATGKELSMSDCDFVFGDTRTKVFTAEADMSALSLYTNYQTAVDFQLWITKGEDIIPYSKYGEPVEGYVLKHNVIDKYLKDELGSAAFKDSTDVVRPNNHNLVESNAVYSAIANAVSSVFEPHGEITVAELTPSLLVTENLGNVYTVSDSGVTNEYFLQGANVPISAKDGVAIVKASADTIMFNLTPGIFDLTALQKKELTQSIAGETTVEGALGAVADDISDVQNVIPSGASASNKLATENGVFPKTYGNLDANNCTESGYYTSINYNVPVNGYSFTLFVELSMSKTYCHQTAKQCVADDEPSVTYVRKGRYIDDVWAWSPWQKIDNFKYKDLGDPSTAIDANTLINTGVYSIYGHGDKHFPFAGWQVLYVTRANNSASFVQQICIDVNGAMYKRVSNTGKWTTWTRLLTSEDFKSVVSSSSDFADFKTRVAALS